MGVIEEVGVGLAPTRDLASAFGKYRLSERNLVSYQIRMVNLALEANGCDTNGHELTGFDITIFLRVLTRICSNLVPQ